MGFKEWKELRLWRRIDFDKEYDYQCVDLIRDYTVTVFWKNYPTSWNAKDLWSRDWWDDYNKHTNTITFVPKVGDIVIWWNGIYWHIAVVTEANIVSFKALEQNAWNGNGDWLGENAIREHTYYYGNVLWFVRHKTLEDKDIVFWLHVSRSWYIYPSSIYWIPVFIRSTSQENLLAISYIKWYTPDANRDVIYITENLLALWYDRLIKTLYHEFEHFIQHRYYSKLQKEFLEWLYLISNDKVFPSNYSKTNYWEFWADIIGYGDWYIKKWIHVPEWKQWNKETQIVYDMLKKIHNIELKEHLKNI